MSALGLRSCQLTLLTSLAFGAVLAVFSAPLTAQTTRDLPKTIPNLSSYDSETRHTMELACGVEKLNGPVAFQLGKNASRYEMHWLQPPRNKFDDHIIIAGSAS